MNSAERLPHSQDEKRTANTETLKTLKTLNNERTNEDRASKIETMTTAWLREQSSWHVLAQYEYQAIPAIAGCYRWEGGGRGDDEGRRCRLSNFTKSSAGVAAPNALFV
ncbi:hypothetical protein AWZ03_008313 [Drosophila navojoa]|uniref:Uncharacterized protein n=1 Tax=Drosophila navojoa TaxID=7232 RepID=A0A484BBQ2_DRONA|nr:hypothetical protein AWZ03_008313 [Drosophila navojoa]